MEGEGRSVHTNHFPAAGNTSQSCVPLGRLSRALAGGSELPRSRCWGSITQGVLQPALDQHLLPAAPLRPSAPLDLQQELPVLLWGSTEALGTMAVPGTSRGHQDSAGGPEQMLLALKGQLSPNHVGSSLPTPSSLQLPVPASPPTHPAQPEGQPQTTRQSLLRKTLQFTCQLFGEDYYMFLPRLFFSLPQSVVGVSQRLTASPAVPKWQVARWCPIRSHLLIVWQTGLNSSAELTACSPRQFASCSVANASLAFQEMLFQLP